MKRGKSAPPTGPVPLYQFTWLVPAGGYEIAEFTFEGPGYDEDGKFHESIPAKAGALVERLELKPKGFTRYAPLLAETGLFRELARIDSDAAIVEFAKRYGWLGIPQEIAPKERALQSKNFPKAAHDWNAIRAERIADWKSEASQLASLLNLWELAQEHDTKGLSRFIRWQQLEDRQRIYFDHPRLGRSVIASDDQPEFFARFQQDDLIYPAFHQILVEVNKKLEKYPSVNKMLWDRTGNELRVYTVPKSLIGAIWLQFAKAIEGNKQYRQCKQCSRWFEVAMNLREDAKYCRQACRFKDYRERQKKARSLYADGISIKEIAKRLDSEVKTVKGWIAS